MKKDKHNFWAVVLVTAIVFAVVAALALVVMLLWNWILPGIILCDKINIFQAAGLLGLTSLLTFDKSKLFSWLYE